MAGPPDGDRRQMERRWKEQREDPVAPLLTPTGAATSSADSAGEPDHRLGTAALTQYALATGGLDRTDQITRYAGNMERVLTARGAATRQRIVEAAAALIRERGVANTGLDDIGAATATSKGQLFHYFPGGKTDLLHAVAVHEAGQVIADQQPYLGDLTTWRKWQAWRRLVIQKYDSQRDRCPLTALTTHMGKATPATREIVTTLYDTWSRHLAAGVQALKDSGEIDASTDVDATATAVLAAIQGGVLMMQATGRISYLETALGEALDAMRRPPSKPHAKLPAKTAAKRS